MRPVDYWASGAGLGNITPRGKAWPEGPDFADWLRAKLDGQHVVEFGCGPGRLAPCFRPELYVGVDVCAQAIVMAEVTHPVHRFLKIGPDDAPPPGDVLLAHTVLLHVPDEDLPVVVGRFCQPEILVSEIMGHQWRRPGDPPVFNRGATDYAEVFNAAGYDLWADGLLPYPHYGATPLTWLKFRRRPT